jgi:hypothetical protein
MLKISQKKKLFYESFCEREIREFFWKIQEYIYIHFSNMESSNLFN